VNKFERVFYVVVILGMFALVILFQARLRETRSKIMEEDSHLSQQQMQHIFSFEAESPEGKKSLVHFTAYSPNYYIFLNTSTNCPHCRAMLQDLQTFKPEKELPENMFVYLVSEEFPEPLPPVNSPVKSLKISFDDRFQLGGETPSGIVVNGKGEIIAHWKGYSRDMLEQGIQAVRDYNNSNTKSIRIKGNYDEEDGT